MTSVTLCRSGDGCFVSCKAQGHAHYAAKGSDIVCSAITVLLRTAAVVLRATEGVRITVDSTERAVLCIEAECYEDASDETKARLVCVADFVESGIRALSAEYPRNVEIKGV